MALVDLVRSSNNSYTLNAADSSFGEVNVEIVVNDYADIFSNNYSHKDYFFWNVFGDQKIYISLPAGKKLVLHSSNMQSLFASFYLSSTANSARFHITDPESPDSSWAFRYKKSPYNGWMLSKNVFFNSVDDFSNVGVCSHFTGFVSGLYIRSKNYPFANSISYTTCSHPDLTAKAATSFIGCAYDSNHCQCPYYSSHSETILSKSINGFMNENSLIYSLTVSMSLEGKYTYQIIRLSDNEVNYTMPVDSRTKETDEKAIEVFEEVISSYQDGFKTVYDCTVSEAQNQKNSFILSLA